MKIQNLNHANVIECRLSGIPCKIAYWNREMYSVLDRKGYHAPWLESKVESWEIDELIAQDRRDRREMNDE